MTGIIGNKSEIVVNKLTGELKNPTGVLDLQTVYNAQLNPSEWIRNSIGNFTSNTTCNVENNFHFTVLNSPVGFRDFELSPDGTYLYIIPNSGPTTIYQYQLSEANTVTQSSTSLVGTFSVSSQETSPFSIQFKSDGSVMYIMGITGDDINYYTLATPWDITTATYSGVTTSIFSLSDQNQDPYCLRFKPDGTKFYLLQNNKYMTEFSLSTAWDLSSTITKINQIDLDDYFSWTTTPTNFSFTPDGQYFIVSHGERQRLNYFKMNTVWDISSAIYITETALTNFLSLISEEYNPFKFVNSGNRLLFAVNGTGTGFSIGSRIYTIDLPQNYFVSDYQLSDVVAFLSSVRTCEALYLKPDGTKLYASDLNKQRIYQYSLDTPFDITSVKFERTKSKLIGTDEETIKSIAFKTDGTKMYVIGTSEKTIKQYSLSTAWDITTAVNENKEKDISFFEVSPTGMYFSTNGFVLFLVGSQENKVFNFALTTAWDVSTATNLSNLDLFSNDITSIFFGNNGNKFYATDRQNKRVLEFDCGVTFDNRSLTLNQTFQDTLNFNNIVDIKFDPDGTKMYVFDGTSYHLNQYTLTTPWDISSATQHVFKNLSYFHAEISPNAFTFNSDGTKIYVIGSTSKRIIEYELKTAWDIEYSYPVLANNYLPYFANTFVATTTTSIYTSHFANNGYTLYVGDNGSKNIYQLDLDVPYNIYSTKLDYSRHHTLAEGTGSNAPDGHFVNFANGANKMFAFDNTDLNVYSMTVQSPGHVGTATYDGTFWSLKNETEYYNIFDGVNPDNTNQFVTFSGNGKKAYVFIIRKNIRTIEQYNLNAAWSINSRTLEYSYQIDATLGPAFILNAMFFNTDGTEFYIANNADTLYRLKLSTPWDLSTSTSSTLESIGLYTTTQSFTFNSDYTKLYLLNLSTFQIVQLNLIKKDNFTLVTKHVTAFINNSTGTSPHQLQFNDDGTKLYVLGQNLYKIDVYDLTVPYEISSMVGARYQVNFQYGTANILLGGLAFANNGHQMYVTANTAVQGHQIIQTDLSIAYKPYSNTAPSMNAKSIFAFESEALKTTVATTPPNPGKVLMKSDGSTFFYFGTSSNRFHQHNLKQNYEIQTSLPWKTVIRNTNFFTSSNPTLETFLKAVYITPNQDYLFMMNSIGNIFKYKLNTPGFLASIANGINPSLTYAHEQQYTGFNLIANIGWTGLTFSDDGLYIFAFNAGQLATNLNYSQSIWKRRLYTPWDLNSIIPSNVYEQSVPNILGAWSKDFKFNSDGTELIYMKPSWPNTAASNGKICVIRFNTPYDLTDIDDSLANEGSVYTKNPKGPSGTFSCLHWREDFDSNLKVIYESHENGHVLQTSYSDVINAAGTLVSNTNWATAVGTIVLAERNETPNTMIFLNDGNSLIANIKGNLHQIEVSTSNTLSTVKYLHYSSSLMPAGVSAYKQFDTNLAGTVVYATSACSVFQQSMTSAWNVRTMAATAWTGFNVNNLAGFDTNHTDIYVKKENTTSKIYLLGETNDRIYEYTLTSPGGTVASGLQRTSNQSFSAFTTATAGFAFAENEHNTQANGNTIIILSNSTPQSFYLMASNTAWSLNGASISCNNTFSVQTLPGVAGSFTTNVDFYIKEDDGTKLYVLDQGGDIIRQFTLSTPWDLSTASYDSKELDVTTQEGTPRYFTFGSNGTKLYITGYTNAVAIYQYNLGTAWDVSTATYDTSTQIHDNVTTITGSGSDTIFNIKFNENGTRVYLTVGTHRIMYFDLETAWDVRSIRKTIDRVFLPGVPAGDIKGGMLTPNNDVIVINHGTYFREYKINDSNGISSLVYATYNTSSNVWTSYPTDTIYGGQFDSDGNLYYTSSGFRTYRKVNLTSPYKLSNTANISIPNSVNYDLTLQSSSLIAIPRSIATANNGYDTFIGVENPDAIIRYRTSQPYTLLPNVIEEVQVIEFDGVADRTLETINPYSMDVSPNGEYMVIGTYQSGMGPGIVGATLSTPYDLDTFKIQMHKVGQDETTPQGLTFGNNGTKMYVIGTSGFQTVDGMYEYDLQQPYEIYDAGQSYFRLGQSTLSNFKVDPSGENFYTLDTGSSDAIKHFKLTTANSLSNYYYTGDQTFNLGIANPRDYTFGYSEGAPQAFEFTSDGSRLFFVGNTETIYQMNLATPWQANTAYYDNIDPMMVDAVSVSFENDGANVFILGSSTILEKYELPVPYQIGTANTLAQQIKINSNTATYMASCQGIQFKPDGTKFYTIDPTSGLQAVLEFDLDTPWDLTTLRCDYIYADGGTSTSLFLSADGTKLYVLDTTNQQVWYYEMLVPNRIGSVKLIDVIPIPDFKPGTNTYGMAFSTPLGVSFDGQDSASFDGKYFYLIDSISDEIRQYELSTPWNLRTARHIETLDISGYETIPTSLTFKNDGTKLFFIGTTGDDVNEFSLSSPWDISTASFVQTKSISAQEATPYSLKFYHGPGATGGTRMFVMGQSGDDINEYSLSTAWDISTATFVRTYSVSLDSATPYGLEFSSDGVYTYMVSSNRIFQYKNYSAWDLSDTYGSTRFNGIKSQETAPTGLVFKPDGTKFWIVGTTSDTVFEYDLATPWVVGTASYNNVSFSVSAQELTPQSIRFKPDGTKMYIVGTTGDDVNEYALSTAWDITTATFSSATSIAAAVGGLADPKSVDFTSDGKFMISCYASSVYTWKLNTAWDTSTLRNSDRLILNSTNLSGAPAGITDPFEMRFKPDGTRIYLTLSSPTTAILLQLDLAEPWSLPTASFSASVNNNTLDLYSSSNDQPWTGMDFSDDGTKLFLYGQSSAGGNEDGIYGFTLGTAWDISTINGSAGQSPVMLSADYTGSTSAVGLQFVDGGHKVWVGNPTTNSYIWEFYMETAYDIANLKPNKRISFLGIDSDPRSVVFNNDGTKFIFLGGQNDSLYEYKMNTAWQLGTAYYTGNNYSLSSTGETQPTALEKNPDANVIYMAGYTLDRIFKYKINSDFNLNTIYTNYLNVTTEETAPQSIYFKSDGTKLYVLGSTGDDVTEYNLSTAWEVGTATYSQVFSVAGQETVPNGIYFKPDGTKMYVIGSTGDDVNEYDLSTPWDISTASFVQLFSVSGQEAVPEGVEFKPDGTKMYVIGSNGDDVNEYDLSTAWDISTASFVQTYGFTGTGTIGETVPSELRFNDDGTKFYIVGETLDKIHQFNLGTAWVVSTAALAYSSNTVNFSGGLFDLNPRGLYMKDDGTKFWVVATTFVQQYNMSTPWDLSTMYSDAVGYIGVPESTPRAITFSNTGMNLFVTGITTEDIHDFSLSLPYEPSTAEYQKAVSHTARYDAPAVQLATGTSSIKFNDDGTKMFILSYTSDFVYSYDLSTPFDITSASIGFLHTPTYVMGLRYSSDGSKLFFRDLGYNNYRQITMNTAWNFASHNANSVISTTYNLLNYAAAGPFGTMDVSSDEKTFFSLDISTYPTILRFNASESGNVGTIYGANGQFNLTFSNVSSNITKIQFSNTNNTLYVFDSFNSNLINYTLPVEFEGNITSNNQDGLGLVVTSTEILPNGKSFVETNNGSIFLSLTSENKVISYSSPYESYNVQGLSANDTFSLNLSEIDNNIQSLYLSPTGNAVYILGTQTNTIYQYSTTNYSVDASSISLANSFDYSNELTNPSSLTLSNTGSKMYLVEKTENKIYEYNLGTVWNVATASYSANTDLNPILENKFTSMEFSKNGDYLYFTGSSENNLYSLSVSVPFDLSNLSNDLVSLNLNSDSISSYYRSSNTTSVTFSDDGKELMVVNSISLTNHRVIKYQLDTPWDISTAYVPYFAINEGLNTYGVFLNSDGTKFYCILSNNFLYEYTLSTPYNFSTKTLINSTALTSFDSDPFDLFFKPDGSEMYILGRTNDSVRQFTLSTPWDISTLSLTNTLSISSQDNTPQSIKFKPDGTKMYILGNTSRKLYEYTLSTAWDISSASYNDVSFDLTSNAMIYWKNSFNYINGTLYGFCFNDDGTKFYVTNNAYIFQCSLSTAWDISTISLEKIGNYTHLNYYSPNGIFHFMLVAGGTKFLHSAATQSHVGLVKLFEKDDIDSIDFPVVGIGAYVQSSVRFAESGYRLYFTNSVSQTIYHGYKNLRYPYHLASTFYLYGDEFTTTVRSHSFVSFNENFNTTSGKTYIDLKFNSTGETATILDMQRYAAVTTPRSGLQIETRNLQLSYNIDSPFVTSGFPYVNNFDFQRPNTSIRLHSVDRNTANLSSNLIAMDPQCIDISDDNQKVYILDNNSASIYTYTKT